MFMRNRRQSGTELSSRDPHTFLDAQSGDLAVSIEQDFRALVEVLSREAERSGNKDGEIVMHIARAREAAERGLRLSERLVKIAESNRAQKQSAH
jgi:translation initiation factor 2 beta subunit (eIF-2beta)/eIF-5